MFMLLTIDLYAMRVAKGRYDYRESRYRLYMGAIKKYQQSFFNIAIVGRSMCVSFFLLFSESEKVFKPEVRRQEKYLTPDMNRRRLIDRAKMKSLRMSVVIVAAFIIWWTPYYIMMIIFTFWNPDKDVSSWCSSRCLIDISEHFYSKKNVFYRLNL